jgi:N-acetylneuraminic acid mutarotase
MKRSLLTLFISGFSVCSIAQNNWVQVDSVNGVAKSYCSAFSINDQGYLLAGLEFGGFTRKMYSYDFTQNDWDNEQSIGGLDGGGLSRGMATAFSARGKGYICCGQGDNANFLYDMWEYDPALDVWTQKADFPGSARRGAVAFVINDLAYVGTGEDLDGLTNDFFKYDAFTNGWGTIANFGGTPRKQAVGFAMGSQGYVGTGNDGVMKNDFWQYQVFQNTWVQKANFPGTPREGAVGWGAFPDGFIALGEDNAGSYRNDLWQYNYFTNQWTQRSFFPASGRKGATVFQSNGFAFVGTGYSGQLEDDMYAYVAITSVEENGENAIVKLYPNPATTNFRIDFDNEKIASIQFFDSKGAESTNAFQIVKSNKAFEIQNQAASVGMYWCVLKDEEGKVIGTQKIIIQ